MNLTLKLNTLFTLEQLSSGLITKLTVYEMQPQLIRNINLPFN